ncbi:pyridoxal-phosphate dependent enzyme [Kangiella japonica]|uniref:Pyridoxal-phosphate dependent enzyme n=1 Tax=Kangiella japonica TaxID=647384 RepID=A0ABN0SWY9_9GAMM
MLKLNPSPIQKVEWQLASDNSISVDIKRDDLLHSIVSGNKWRKLKYLLADAKVKSSSHIMTMGGNWSNHLHAVAFAGKTLGFKTTGIVRAHPEQALTPTLKDCKRWGMELRFTTRREYAKYRKFQAWDSFHNNQPNSYWLSEGGFSELAIKGVMDIADEVDKHYDYIVVACGSGATLCGLAKAFPKTQIIGVAAFAGAEYLRDELALYVGCELENWIIDTEHHCGGFAKTNESLKAVATEIESNNNFKLDFVYNAKSFLALSTRILTGAIAPGSNVLIIHTGGLQGRRD